MSADCELIFDASGRVIASIHPCDFCDGTASFKTVFDRWGVSSWSEGLHGAGSDYLAIWCGGCGAKHRTERRHPAEAVNA
jgi:hypothetical protein